MVVYKDLKTAIFFNGFAFWKALISQESLGFWRFAPGHVKAKRTAKQNMAIYDG